MKWPHLPRPMTEDEQREGLKEDPKDQLVYDPRVAHAKEIAWQMYQTQFIHQLYETPSK